jgi:hypothetical protein
MNLFSNVKVKQLRFIKRGKRRLGVVVHFYNPSYSGGLRFEVSLSKNLVRPPPYPPVTWAWW